MVTRRQVGEPLAYKGRTITTTMLGPDLLSYVDEIEMPHFYLSLTAARKAAMRYVDTEIKEQEKSRG